MDASKAKQLEEELTKRAKIYVESVDGQDKILKADHIKKEYTFSLQEKRRLLQQESIILMINQAIEDIISLTVLPRLGIDPAKAKILYDVSLGRLTVWQSKTDS